jgi:hypothetical protein
MKLQLLIGAAAKLGLPKGNWHRTDYLRLLKLLAESFDRISEHFETAAQVIMSKAIARNMPKINHLKIPVSRCLDTRGVGFWFFASGPSAGLAWFHLSSIFIKFSSIFIK